MTASPYAVVCPNCNAQIHEPCTQPTDNDRKPVRWFHHSREVKAELIDVIRQVMGNA